LQIGSSALGEMAGPELSSVALEAQDLVQYDFAPRVRSVLLEYLPAVDTIEVINSVSAAVERRWNQVSDQDFRAFLTDPNVEVPEELSGLRSFASVTADILEQLGGEYAQFAQSLRLITQDQPFEDSISVFFEIEVNLLRYRQTQEVEDEPIVVPMASEFNSPELSSSGNFTLPRLETFNFIETRLIGELGFKEEADDQLAKTSESEMVPNPASNSARILIIECHEVWQTILREYVYDALRRMNEPHEGVYIASNFQEARNAMELGGQWDLLVSSDNINATKVILGTNQARVLIALAHDKKIPTIVVAANISVTDAGNFLRQFDVIDCFSKVDFTAFKNTFTQDIIEVLTTVRKRRKADTVKTLRESILEQREQDILWNGYALIVGVSDYSGLNNFLGAATDARDIYSTLIDAGYPNKMFA
jgi:hypothetical protein